MNKISKLIPKFAQAIGLGVVIIFLGVICIHLFTSGYKYTDGYKQAYKDYKSGMLECVVKVKYPELLEE